MTKALWGLCSLVLLAACNGPAAAQPAVTGAPHVTPHVTPAAVTPVPVQQGTLGQPVHILQFLGAPFGNVSVVSMEHRPAYGDYSKSAMGAIWAFSIRYDAEADIDVNTLNWQAFADNAKLNSTYVISGGPGPTLESGTLPTGRSQSGWIYFDGPPRPSKFDLVFVTYDGKPLAQWEFAP